MRPSTTGCSRQLQPRGALLPESKPTHDTMPHRDVVALQANIDFVHPHDHLEVVLPIPAALIRVQRAQDIAPSSRMVV